MRDLGRRAWDWVTVADARPAPGAVYTPAPRPPARRRPVMLFDGSSYRPVDEVISEMYRGDRRATQEEALAVPGVLRARNLICGVATWPLVDLTADNVRHANPLLDQMDPNVTNVVTISQFIQDLLFEGYAWGRVLTTDYRGYPTHMEHLAFHRVTLVPSPDADGASPLPAGHTPREAGQLMRIHVDGSPADHRMIKRFDSPNPGVLVAAGDTVKLAATYRRTAIMYANNPRMDGFLYPKEGATPLQDDEVEDLLNDWETQRRDHVTGYMPASLGYESVANISPKDLQLVELHEQATREVALALGLDPADLGVPGATETYSNRIDKRIDRINDLLSAYVLAFTQRLSMGDITPRGHRVWADPNTFLRANPKERIEYYKGMKELEAFDSDDVADAENVPRKPKKAAPAPPPNVLPFRPPAPGQPATDPAAAGGALDSRMAQTGAGFAAEAVRFESEVTFAAAADAGRRTIAGRALPYGVQHIARKNGHRYRFQQGSIRWPNPRHVPLLIDHVPAASVGGFLSIVDGPEGTDVVARAASGPAGDQALTWASPEESVRTGFSVGVDFNHEDCVPDPYNPGVWLVPVGAAEGKEISLVAVPAFQGARVATVTLAADGGTVTAPVSFQQPGTGPANPNPPAPAPQQPPQPAPQPAPAPQPQQPPADPAPQPQPQVPTGQFSADQMGAVLAAFLNQQPAVDTSGPGPMFVDPTKGLPAGQPGQQPPGQAQVTAEAAPYRFDWNGNLGEGPQYDFSRDLVAGARGNAEAHDRAVAFMQEMMRGSAYGMRRHEFAVVKSDVATLNPVRQRPDLYVDQREYLYPLYQATNRGTLKDITAFTLPKFNTSSGLVNTHTEGSEPTSGAVTATSQTITPTAKSGAIDITRETWDQGGNPQATAIIWRQFTRAWYEGLEGGVAAFLNTLTAAIDIALNTGATAGQAPTGPQLAGNWNNAIARLQFTRGGDRFDMFAVEQELWAAFANATGSDGRPLFPMLGPSNTNGTAGRRYRTMDLAGVEGVPSWALPSVAGSPNNSWLFDSEVVHTWDTGPQRFEFAGMTAAGAYAPVAMIRLAVWGYQALANTDLSGVRQVIYDTTT